MVDGVMLNYAGNACEACNLVIILWRWPAQLPPTGERRVSKSATQSQLNLL